MENERGARNSSRNPPVATRFKPGQSGNPKGRPKGTRRVSSSFAEALEAELNVILTVSEGSRRRKIKKVDAVAKRLFQKALSGEMPAIQLLSRLLTAGQKGEALSVCDCRSPERMAAAKDALAKKLAGLRVFVPVVGKSENEPTEGSPSSADTA